MLNIYRVDHIGQVVPELEPQVKLLEGLFGFRRRRSWESTDDGCRGVLLDVPGSWGHRWEVLAPLGANSPLRAFLEGRGAGLHHVAVEVPDMDAAARQIKELGLDAQPPESGPSGRWLDVPFGPPESKPGLLFRLFGPPLPGVCGDNGPPRATSEPRPGGEGQEVPSLGIVAIEQVGHGYPDRDELVRWSGRAFGMREVCRTPEGQWPDMATLVMTIPGTQIRWEILQPVGEDSFVQRFLDKRGAAAHHITFEVRDWEQALAASERHGIPTFGTNEGETDGARWADTFIHPRHTGGFLTQLFWEERPGVWSRSDKVAPARAETPWT